MDIHAEEEGASMTKALEKMKTTLAKKQQELKELQAEVRSFERVVRHYEAHPDELETRIAAPAEVKDAALRILTQANKPLHYKDDIYARLLEEDIAVAGEEPARNLGAYLSNDPSFHSHGNGLWGLSKWNKTPTLDDSRLLNHNV